MPRCCSSCSSRRSGHRPRCAGACSPCVRDAARRRRRRSSNAGVERRARRCATGSSTLDAEPVPADCTPRRAACRAPCARSSRRARRCSTWLDDFPPDPDDGMTHRATEFRALLADGGPALVAAAHRVGRPATLPSRARRRARCTGTGRSSSIRWRRFASNRLAPRHELVAPRNRSRRDARQVLLAALALDALRRRVGRRGGRSRGGRCSGSISAHAIEQSVAALVNDIELLPAAARRPDALAEEAVLQIAVHLGQRRASRRALPARLAGADFDHVTAGRLEVAP